MMQIHLRSGFTMPQLGMGTWKPDVDEGTIHGAVFEAIRCGYRHIDCAANYGNECEIGSAIRDADVDRESLFITSKLWNDAHAAADVEKACRQSLSDLGLEYLDLYLIHWPVAEGADPRPSIEETWRAMEALVDAGLVRTIGVSNFSITKLRALCDKARLPPAVNQVELHPLWRQACAAQLSAVPTLLQQLRRRCCVPLTRPARLRATLDPARAGRAARGGLQAGRPPHSVRPAGLARFGR
jgi:alcohol dehydrogenase (NADP+)